MLDQDNELDGLLAKLHQEFIEMARDQIEDIETSLDWIDSGAENVDERLLSIRRHVHNIKGQGGTFGFPLTGRVAHMLEDYLKNTGEIKSKNVTDIRAYLDLMVDLVGSDESIALEDPQGLLNALPSGQEATFSSQKPHDVNVLLVMPSGLQRKMIATELLSCGFRVMRAYSSVEALSVAVDIKPDIMFVNYEMAPFDGTQLCNVFAAVDHLRDIHIVLLTSHEPQDDHLQHLPATVSVVEKRTDFLDRIGELLIQWGVFGDIPS